MIRIITDSYCGFYANALDTNVSILPISFNFIGDATTIYKDMPHYSNDDFYRRLNLGLKVNIISLTKEAILEAITSAYKQGEDVLFLVPSYYVASSTVRSYEEAIKTAKELYPTMNIAMVNTNNISLGMGLLVQDLSKMAQEGATLKDLLSYIEENKSQYKTLFYWPNIEQMYERKFISGSNYRLYKMFNAKPIYRMNDAGILKFSKAVRSLDAAQNYLSGIIDEHDQNIVIMHSHDEAHAQNIRTLLANTHDKDASVMEMNKTMGSIMGPKVLGLAYYKKNH